MNTSELLVLIFVFLVGYMLFKRCGCTEGIVNEKCSATLESLCGTEQKFPSQGCAKCTGGKKAPLKVAGCTAENVDDFCHTNTMPMQYGGLCYISAALRPFIDQDKLKKFINGSNSITANDCGALNEGTNNMKSGFEYGGPKSIEWSKSSLCAWLKKLKLDNLNNCNANNANNPWQ